VMHRPKPHHVIGNLPPEQQAAALAILHRKGVVLPPKPSVDASRLRCGHPLDAQVRVADGTTPRGEPVLTDVCALCSVPPLPWPDPKEIVPPPPPTPAQQIERRIALIQARPSGWGDAEQVELQLLLLLDLWLEFQGKTADAGERWAIYRTEQGLKTIAPNAVPLGRHLATAAALCQHMNPFVAQILGK